MPDLRLTVRQPAGTQDSAHKQPPATVLGFDFGLKKIGVALGNTLLCQASPLEIIHGEGRDRRFARIEQLLHEWQPDYLVVGLPLDSAGAEQLASRQSRRFARQLQGRYGLPVVLVDERGSSLEAQQILGTNAADDAYAAAVILQRYFDTQMG